MGKPGGGPPPPSPGGRRQRPAAAGGASPRGRAGWQGVVMKGREEVIGKREEVLVVEDD